MNRTLILVLVSMWVTNCATHRYGNFGYMETSSENYVESSQKKIKRVCLMLMGHGAPLNNLLESANVDKLQNVSIHLANDGIDQCIDVYGDKL